jgi:hypothetical protein
MMVDGRLVQHLPTLTPHWPKDVSADDWFGALARLGSPRLMRQFRFNPATDELMPVSPAEPCPAVQPVRLRHDLQGIVNWGNPVRMDEQGLSWLEVLVDPTEDSLLMVRQYDFDAADGMYHMTDKFMHHQDRPDFRAGEPSLAQIGPNDWLVAARCFKNSGNTLLYRTADPMTSLGSATELATTFGQRMLYRFADGSIRLTLNHQKESPYQDRRNPLYCYRIDPETLQAVEKSIVFDSRAAGLNLHVPFVDHTHLFEPHRPGTQLLTFRLIAELVEKGVNVPELSRKMYDSYPRRRLELLKALLNSARFDCDDRVASFTLVMETAKKLGVLPEDNEGLIDHLRAVEGVQVAVFFEELPENKVRVSMRSKEPRFDVCKICGLFGGAAVSLLVRVIDLVEDHVTYLVVGQEEEIAVHVAGLLFVLRAEGLRVGHCHEKGSASGCCKKSR